ncbi:hypothetical protein I4F81_007038 [Pyropia yezoensis]|uniref:Uncharacterized protein n=1 Tax=Pyropia yezoensis TaxID=2788 RepID=A0ACC3C3W1_PYRYE|nr:hypothetical protein I4F81_007038 [Neopyropia yezoensis]
MRAFAEVIGTATGDASPAVLLFFDDARYVFNAGDGTQRYCNEAGIKVTAKLRTVLLTGLAPPAVGGLLGLLLTAADAGMEAVSVVAPVGLRPFFDAARPFYHRPALATRLVEVAGVGARAGVGATANAGAAEPVVVVEDANVVVTAVPLVPLPPAVEEGDALGAAPPPTLPVVIAYIARLRPGPGKFDAARAAALGVPPGPDRGRLVRGEAVTVATADGGTTTVSPADVLSPPTPGPVVVVLDIPSMAAGAYGPSPPPPACLATLRRGDVALRVLGTGACLPGKHRNVSGSMLHLAGRGNVLLDAGEGTYGQLVRALGRAAADAAVAATRLVFISHLHADHHLGLLSFLHRRRGLTAHPLLLLGLSLVTVPVDHCPAAYGVTLTDTVRGWSFVYSGDTRPCAGLAAAGAAVAPVLALHEATLDDALSAEAAAKAHCTTGDALGVPFFLPEEEELLVRYVRTRALIGRGLTRDAFLDTCEEYILALSPERQAMARARFNAKTRPGCTVAFTVSPSGTVAPYFAVVEGSGPGHAFVTVADDGGSRQVALASRLNDGAVVVRRKPPGFDKALFDLFAAMFAKWAKQFFPNEKGADGPAPDVDLALLAARLVPVVRKDMAQPVVTNGTLSTAGTAVVLTAPQVIQALQDLEQDKLDMDEAKEAGKRAREQRASDKLAEKAAKDAAAKRRRAELVWRQVCQLTAEVAQLRVSAVLPTRRKQTHRLRAARQQRRVGAGESAAPFSVLWWQVGQLAARVARGSTGR